MTFVEAMAALAKGERVEARSRGATWWCELTPTLMVSVGELYSYEYRLIPRKTRIQEMAREVLGDTYVEFSERVVREVCKYLRAESAEPFARDVEREFLGGMA